MGREKPSATIGAVLTFPLGKALGACRVLQRRPDLGRLVPCCVWTGEALPPLDDRRLVTAARSKNPLVDGPLIAWPMPPSPQSSSFVGRSLRPRSSGQWSATFTSRTGTPSPARLCPMRGTAELYGGRYPVFRELYERNKDLMHGP